MNIFEADRATQEAWLLAQFPTETMDDLIVRIYSEAYGVFILFDESQLNDMVDHPSAYDLGEIISLRLATVDKRRAHAIDNGAVLTTDELASLKAYILEQQSEGEGGYFCSGLHCDLVDGQSLFASFVGQSEGQGGIAYHFDRLFSTQQKAEIFYKRSAEEWIGL